MKGDEVDRDASSIFSAFLFFSLSDHSASHSQKVECIAMASHLSDVVATRLMSKPVSTEIRSRSEERWSKVCRRVAGRPEIESHR